MESPPAGGRRRRPQPPAPAGVRRGLQENDTSAFKKKKVVKDDGTTDWVVVRPRFSQLLADLDSGAIDGVIFYDLDRLVRRPGTSKTSRHHRVRQTPGAGHHRRPYEPYGPAWTPPRRTENSSPPPNRPALHASSWAPTPASNSFPTSPPAAKSSSTAHRPVALRPAQPGRPQPDPPPERAGPAVFRWDNRADSSTRKIVIASSRHRPASGGCCRPWAGAGVGVGG
ncbi:recombinase family protein [Streptomyces sp. SL13]|uniref:Recombinase family protein n=1 Tax=Streptantibioticus silvisoli TaxID=2705255 RepID=A0AA90GTX7_9ACTN|nr:recombinase family protein [Streptantibioticus silvisoli]MDI5967998.1 recombinase family protein [Streptantibioticus silvisoli]